MEKIYSKKNRKIMLAIQLLLLFFPGVQIISISTDTGSIPGSVCYFYSIIFLPFLVWKIKNLAIPKWYIIGMPIFAVFNSILHIGTYGIAKGVLHWLFGLYILIVIVNVGEDIIADEWKKMLGAIACVFLLSHLLLQVLNYKTIEWLVKGYFDGTLNGIFGCDLPSLTRGGRNLDCSWLALFGLFVEGKKRKWYQVYTLTFSLLGSSRSGIIASVMLIAFNLWRDRNGEKRKEKNGKVVVELLIFIGVILATGIFQANINRSGKILPAPKEMICAITGLQEKGDEYQPFDWENMYDTEDDSVKKVLSGRKAIWEKVPKMFADNPWGYGAGNAMVIMKSDYGFDSFEDVVHNVFMQWLLDEGIIGGIWYIGLLCAFLRKQWKNMKSKVFTPYDVFFGGYFILGLVQFHGAEALMFFVLGIYLLELGQIKQLGKERIM